MAVDIPRAEEFLSDEAEERQIEKLLIDYFDYLDSGDIEKWADCYTDDALVEGLKGQLKGREAILNYGRKTANRGFFLHFVTNIRIRIEGPSSASATCNVLYTQHEGDGQSVVAAARERDRLVKIAGRWRLSERRVVGRPLLGTFA